MNQETKQWLDMADMGDNIVEAMDDARVGRLLSYIKCFRVAF